MPRTHHGVNFAIVRLLSLLAIPSISWPAMADSGVDPAHKHAWGENIGWTNWRDAGNPPGSLGASFHASFLAGFIWGENVGWINLGDGDPGPAGGNEVSYANATGLDFGVNVNSGTGALYGRAWGENVGWINFDGGALASIPHPARIDFSSNPPRLRGFAWGENIGWINLDHAVSYVGLVASCDPCDANCDGSMNQFDIQPFVLTLLGGAGCSDCAADTNGDGSVNQFDIQGFVRCLGG